MKRTHITVVAIVAVLLIGGATVYLMAHASAHAGKKTPVATNQTATTPPATTTVATPEPGAAKSTAPGAVSSTATPPQRTASNAGTTTTNAQPRQAGQRGNRPQMSDGMRAKFTLMRLVMGLPRLDEAKLPLSPAQAKDLLAVLTPLRKQPTLTADDASKALDRVKAILSSEQVAALSQFHRGQRGDGQGRPQGQGAGRPDGQGQGQPGPRANGERRPTGNGEQPAEGRTPAGRPEMREDMNPFNMSGDNPMMQRMQERMNAVFTQLEEKAK